MSSSPVHVAATVTLVSYSDGSLLTFSFPGRHRFPDTVRNTVVFLLLQHLKRIRILGRHSCQGNKEERKPS